MAYYSFNIKKGKIELEITSDDKYFVDSQLEKSYSKSISKKGKKAKEKKKKEVAQKEVVEVEKKEVVEAAIPKKDVKPTATKDKKKTPVKEEKQEVSEVKAEIEEEVKAEVPEIQAEVAEVKTEADEIAKPEVVEDKAEADEIAKPEVVEDKAEADEIAEPEVVEDKVEADEIAKAEVVEDKVEADEIAKPEVVEDKVEADEIAEPEAVEDKAEVEEEIKQEVTEEQVAPTERKSFKTANVDEVKPQRGSFNTGEVTPMPVEDNLNEELPDEELSKEELPKEELTKAVDDFLMSGASDKENAEQKPAPEPSAPDFQDILNQKIDEPEIKDTKIDTDLPQSEEEKEVTDALEACFSSEEEEEPKKKSKVYDILQEKLSSIPDAVKNRLNLSPQSEDEEAEVEEVSEPVDESALKFNDIEDLVFVKKPQTKLDYLLVAAYFLQQKEFKNEYSLKQINSRIMKILKEPIDHSVIHEAVAHNYFAVVPDYSGEADVTKYQITVEGVDYIINEL